MKLRTLVLSVALASASFASASAFADTPGHHPAYIHAMSDLRAAKWLLEHQQGDWKRTGDEIKAVHQVDAALRDLHLAAIDDGKRSGDHPQVDTYPDNPGRLHAALDFLKRARDDISQEEDNGWANGLRDRSYGHIDAAISATRHAIHE